MPQDQSLIPPTSRRRNISAASIQALEGLGRFSRRTYSTTEASDFVVTEDEEGLITNGETTHEHTISNTETIIHLLKGNIGIGVLTMPIAISNAGLVGGVLGMIFVAFITIHCMHTLVIAAQKMVAQQGGTGFLDYADTAGATFERAGGVWAKFSGFIRKLLNIFLCMSQIGSNAVYILFVAQNILPIIENHYNLGWNYRLYIALLLLPMILACSIRNLKYISPFSIVANILEFVGLGIVFYFIFVDSLPDSSTVPWFAPASNFPIFFGTAIFAFEGISVVLPIENQMTNKKDMLGWNGVLNTSMVTIACLYIGMGFFGYLKYGDNIDSTITLNLPVGNILAESAMLMFSLAIFFSYALQFYVVMEILGPNILRPNISDRFYSPAEYLVRALLNIVTFGLAASVPWLDLLVSLLGAVKMSTLSLMAPALIDSAAHWNTDSPNKKRFRAVKNTFIFIIGFLAMFVGTYISMSEIIHNFADPPSQHDQREKFGTNVTYNYLMNNNISSSDIFKHLLQ